MNPIPRIGRNSVAGAVHLRQIPSTTPGRTKLNSQNVEGVGGGTTQLVNPLMPGIGRNDETRGRAGLGSRRAAREKQGGQVRYGGRPQMRVNRTD